MLMGGVRATIPSRSRRAWGSTPTSPTPWSRAWASPWQTALGAVFISGVVFFLLTLVGLRQLIIAAIPVELYAAVAAGVGLFIALIGFRNSGIIVPNPATTVTLGNLRDPNTALAVVRAAR